MKLPSVDLNSDLYPSHPTNTYTCRMIIVPRVCDCCLDFSKRSVLLKFYIFPYELDLEQ